MEQYHIYAQKIFNGEWQGFDVADVRDSFDRMFDLGIDRKLDAMQKSRHISMNS